VIRHRELICFFPITDAGRTVDVGGGEIPDLTVYRSYAGGFTGESATTPDNDDVGGGGRLTVVADSVPDIKIYRRSRILYNDDEEDDVALHYSNHRSVCSTAVV